MNFTNFISNRILKSKSHRFSKPIVTISIISIALGVCVLILVFAITTGFRSEIQNKVIGFGSHIEISYFDNNESYQKIPIYKNSSFVTQIKQMPNVKNIQVYASKAGILKTKDEIEGIVLKGIDVDYDHSFFSKHLVKGEIIKLRDSTIVNDILISEITANVYI
jgi:lipoprotein-releasing system permease protein